FTGTVVAALALGDAALAFGDAAFTGALRAGFPAAALSFGPAAAAAPVAAAAAAGRSATRFLTASFMASDGDCAGFMPAAAWISSTTLSAPAAAGFSAPEGCTLPSAVVVLNSLRMASVVAFSGCVMEL